MYKKILIPFSCLFGLVILAGCSKSPDNGDQYGDSFKAKTEYGVYSIKSNILFSPLSYDKKTTQLVVSGDKKTTRIQSDDQFEYLICQLNAVPTLNQEVTVNVKAKGIDNWDNYEIYTGQVVKISDGKAWVWSSQMNTGFIVAAP